MMTDTRYRFLVSKLIAYGYANDIAWAQWVGPPKHSQGFARETIFVICCSGMKEQIARKISDGIWDFLTAYENNGRRIPKRLFRHDGKRKAIDRVWRNRTRLFDGFMRLETDEERLDFLEAIPWIGPITKFHLAKNFGVDCVKPDRHLERIAASEGETPEALCGRLAEASGHRIGTVDYVLWRSANSGLIKTRELRSQYAPAD